MHEHATIEHDRWWGEIVADLVEILLELGERGCAERILDHYCEAQRSARWQVAATVEQRCRALLRAVDGDLDGALTRLDDAVAAGGGDRWSTDLGRSLLARGSLHRLHGRTWQARSDLKRALAIFTRHGHGGWRAAALRALVATVDADSPLLTAAQPARIIAVLTGGHWTDHEIAARLQLSLLAVQREIGGPSSPDLPIAQSR